MIKVNIIGGLGNQMFQYAAAAALAHKHQCSFSLDISAFETYDTHKYLLGQLNVPQSHIAPPIKKNKFHKLTSLIRKKNIYHEPFYHYDKNFFDLPNDIELHGYFQSPLYFKDITNTLRQQFTLRDQLSPQNKKLQKQIQDTTIPVSIHIRRGDYVNNKIANKFHGTISIEYYKKAMRIIQSLYGNDIHLFMFSDDPNWLKENIKLSVPSTIVEGIPGRPFEDIHLMSQCHHNIIANSSFSWWAAWLNPFQNKQVIAPRQWFAPHTLREQNITDLCPKEWILI